VVALHRFGCELLVDVLREESLHEHCERLRDLGNHAGAGLLQLALLLFLDAPEYFGVLSLALGGEARCRGACTLLTCGPCGDLAAGSIPKPAMIP